MGCQKKNKKRIEKKMGKKGKKKKKEGGKKEDRQAKEENFRAPISGDEGDGTFFNFVPGRQN